MDLFFQKRNTKQNSRKAEKIKNFKSPNCVNV